MSTSKQSRSFYLKLAISVGLLAILYNQLNITEVTSIFTSLDYRHLLIATLLAILAIVLSAYKWQILLVARGWQLSILTLTKVYFVGLFMNNFLPSSIGGDVMRIYQVGKEINNTGEAAASVILERLLATFGIIIPALFALIPNKNITGDLTSYMLYFFAATVLLMLLFFKPTLLKPLTRLSWYKWQKGLLKIKEVYDVIHSYKNVPRSIFKVLLLSVIFQLLIVIINFFILKAMGISIITLWQCTLVIPIISAVSMIPLSINGLGLREGSYVLLFANFGLSPSQAVTLSLTFFIVVTLISLLGGVFFLLDGQKEVYGIAK